MLTRILFEFGKDIAKIVRMVMDSNVGINKKSGHNTLSNSDIYKQLSVISTSDGDLVFDIMLNDYITFIESGRRKGAKMPPVEPIVRWCKKKGIPTDNSTIYLIRRAISRDGIQPRPVMETVFKELDREWQGAWSDRLFGIIIEQLDNFFK